MINDPLQMGLDFRHWTEGGTAITNFGPDEFDRYIEAIQRFGDRDLVVSDSRFGWTMGKLPGGSLHDIARRGDLSPFWRVFEKVRTER